MTRGGQGLPLLSMVTAASLWGISGVVAKKALVGADISVPGLLVLRLAGTAVTLALVLAVTSRDGLRPPRAAWPLIAAAGMSMCALQFLYYLTITATNVGTAVFLEYLAPTLLVLYGWARRVQPFEKWSLAAVTVALAGSYALVGAGGRLQLSPGALATGLGCAVTLALQTIFFEQLLRHLSHIVASFWVVLGGLLAAAVVGEPSALWTTAWTSPNVLAVAYLSVGAMVVPLLLMLVALRRLGAAKTGIVSTLEPVVAAVAAWLVLGEALAPVQWAGGAMIAVAVVFITRAPLPRAPAPGEPAPALS